MTPRDQLISHAAYLQVLKGRLPQEAFRPRLRKLLVILAHLTIVGACYAAFHLTSSIALYLLLAIVIGHSLMCMVFLAHELSHNTILRQPLLRYPLEVFLWGMNLIPATMWRRLHNQTHHIYSNTLRDPDRFFLKSELDAPDGRSRRWYTRLFFPHRLTSRWNLLVGFHFITYVLRHLLAVIYPRDLRPSVVTYKPSYTVKQRLHIVGEVIVIVAMQVGVYFAVGGDWLAYLFASPIAILFTSTFAMTYIWTNHYLHGLFEIHDPVAGSTSVEVPRLFDWLHSNFSYHTEHHLFPNVNADYYPLVSRLLIEYYPDRYHRLPMTEAWRLLWRGEPFIQESENVSPARSDAELALEQGQEFHQF
jgi:fatty acid desaturase